MSVIQEQNKINFRSIITSFAPLLLPRKIQITPFMLFSIKYKAKILRLWHSMHKHPSATEKKCPYSWTLQTFLQHWQRNILVFLPGICLPIRQVLFSTYVYFTELFIVISDFINSISTNRTTKGVFNFRNSIYILVATFYCRSNTILLEDFKCYRYSKL